MTAPSNIPSISIILPVFNEELNLRWLIPQIYEEVFKIVSAVEVIVVDDNSTDGTKSLMNSIKQRYPSLIFLERSSRPSLSRSIEDGIAVAKSNKIAWMDADGSMPVDDLVRMIHASKLNPEAVVVGSRFVQGGGFKGINQNGSTSFFDFLGNIRKSNDSISAVILSRIFNKFLRNTIRVNVKDLTSGFVLLNKEELYGFNFEDSYGEYFPRLIYFLDMQGLTFIELGYICLPRQYGVSKTGTRIWKLVIRGIPYLRVAIRIFWSDSRNRRNKVV
jgi:glycosyltransferase involved in cell wall biosynthesis